MLLHVYQVYDPSFVNLLIILTMKELVGSTEYLNLFTNDKAVTYVVTDKADILRL